jgi:hypothetical protein
LASIRSVESDSSHFCNGIDYFEKAGIVGILMQIFSLAAEPLAMPARGFLMMWLYLFLRERKIFE